MFNCLSAGALLHVHPEAFVCMSYVVGKGKVSTFDADAKGKKPWRADRAHAGAGPSNGGSGCGGGAVYAPHHEMRARHLARLGQFCAHISSCGI